MITRITIDHTSPEHFFAVLNEWAKRTQKAGVIPPMEVLSDDRPYAVGSVVSYDPSKKLSQRSK